MKLPRLWLVSSVLPVLSASLLWGGLVVGCGTWVLVMVVVVGTLLGPEDSDAFWVSLMLWRDRCPLGVGWVARVEVLFGC